MAELETNTDVPADPRRSAVVARQYGRRFPLAPNKDLNLGRDEAKMDLAIPEDDQISRFQAILRYDSGKSKLVVITRPPQPPDYPNPPANQTLVYNAALKKLVEAPDGSCAVSHGESFWIGQTRFTFHSDQGPSNEIQSRSTLEEFDKNSVYVSTRNLIASLRNAKSEKGVCKFLLRTVLEEMPRVEVVSILSLPAGRVCETDIKIEDLVVREEASAPKFTPSRQLVIRAAKERRACYHVWKNSALPTEYDRPIDLLATGHALPPIGTQWVVVAPFHGSSQYLLYAAGCTQGAWNLLGESVQQQLLDEITRYQITAELLVGACETTLRALRCEQQVQAIRRAWPQGLWKLLDDPDALEKMLAPKEMEITTLFCDLRNYSLFASQNAGDLLAAQTNVSGKLSVMSGAITDRDGVVGGFRGDAVLGFWGWPKPDALNVVQAARAAINIEGRLNEWTRKNRRCGVAITHGTAVAGRLGANDLAVVDLYGPVVNLTFRFEAMTKAFEVPIIVNEAVAKRLEEIDPDGKTFVTRQLGKVRAKGFPEPVWAYELYSPQHTPFREQDRDEWARAVNSFTVGNWTEATKQFRDVFDEDSAAKCLLRCIDATNGKPPADWDGSFTPTEPPAKG